MAGRYGMGQGCTKPLSTTCHHQACLLGCVRWGLGWMRVCRGQAATIAPRAVLLRQLRQRQIGGGGGGGGALKELGKGGKGDERGGGGGGRRAGMRG